MVLATVVQGVQSLMAMAGLSREIGAFSVFFLVLCGPSHNVKLVSITTVTEPRCVRRSMIGREHHTQ